MPAKILKITIGLLFLAAIAVGITYWVQYNTIHPSTDDAYVQAHTITIAPRINGMVDTMEVHNHARVHKDQLLFTIDQAPYQIALQKAQANLLETTQAVSALQAQVKSQQALVAERQAQLINTQKESKRTLTMVKKNLISQSAGDQAISQLKVAQAALIAAKAQLEQTKKKLGDTGSNNAQIKAAQAAVKSAQLNIKYTKVYAPADGFLVNLTLQAGNPVTAYQGLFSIVKNNKWWVSANFKETQLERIKVGQAAIIEIDMYPGHIFHGRVASFSPGSGTSFSILPPENATGNWVKVTQRFPVWIDINHSNPKYPLLMGSSCKVTINTTTP